MPQVKLPLVTVQPPVRIRFNMADERTKLKHVKGDRLLRFSSGPALPWQTVFGNEEKPGGLHLPERLLERAKSSTVEATCARDEDTSLPRANLPGELWTVQLEGDPFTEQTPLNSVEMPVRFPPGHQVEVRSEIGWERGCLVHLDLESGNCGVALHDGRWVENVKAGDDTLRYVFPPRNECITGFVYPNATVAQSEAAKAAGARKRAGLPSDSEAARGAGAQKRARLASDPGLACIPPWQASDAYTWPEPAGMRLMVPSQWLGSPYTVGGYATFDVVWDSTSSESDAAARETEVVAVACVRPLQASEAVSEGVLDPRALHTIDDFLSGLGSMGLSM
jgi:hypothetical protein